jgi:hypothetical protein
MRFTSALGIIALVSLGVAGCGGGGKKFTPEDFKKVEKGMAEEKATEILGKPFDSAEALGIKRLWWKVGDSYYSASFKDGKVSATDGPGNQESYEAMKALMASAPKPKPTAAVAAGPDDKDAVAALKKANAELRMNRAGTNVEAVTIKAGGPEADQALAHLKGLPGLQYLFLQFSGVSDAGLKHLSGLSKLESIYLTKTRITDAGLENLKGLTALDELRLSENDNITDKGLASLADLKNLKYLYVVQTKVTPAGIAKLKAALPNCEIKDK